MNKISFQDKEIIDIDEIFRLTNQNYVILLENLGLPITFDFSKRNNKKLYTHEFIKTFTEFLKNNSNRNFIFFSNNSNKDKFRNQLFNKIKKIFKIRIWEENCDIDHFQHLINIKDCNTISGLEMAFLSRKSPSFQKISKYLEKEGLTFLNEEYFQNVVNKMIIFNH